ncbi:MAG: hypothetical protein ABEH47_01420 [Haloferacaceae archaeon]
MRRGDDRRRAGRGGGVLTPPDVENVDRPVETVAAFNAACDPDGYDPDVLDGNATGGLFYDNYPGGTGLTNAAVFGRVAAESAVEHVGGRAE